MSKKDIEPSKGGSDAAQRSELVPQHKRLAQGAPLPGNQTGAPIKSKN